MSRLACTAGTMGLCMRPESRLSRLLMVMLCAGEPGPPSVLFMVLYGEWEAFERHVPLWGRRGGQRVWKAEIRVER